MTTELEDIMATAAKGTGPECLSYPVDDKLVCPCCGGAGEHYTHPQAPYMQDVDRSCSFCNGWGYVVMQRFDRQSK